MSSAVVLIRVLRVTVYTHNKVTDCFHSNPINNNVLFVVCIYLCLNKNTCMFKLKLQINLCGLTRGLCFLLIYIYIP